VDANGDDTTVNIYRDVRMRGEALARDKRGLRATFIYTGQDLPAGYGYIGYPGRVGILPEITIFELVKA
ncbi:MAG: hypothetical protein EOO77_39860, partial [Oxalobacteraceae bacterium]